MSQSPRAATLNHRIRSDIEGRIRSGEWPPGHRIPFEHELMAQYACSRMTVNKVLAMLADAGMIERRRRAGSFVARPHPHMEQVALDRVLRHWTALGMEGIVLVDEGQPIAFAIGSRLTEDTFDIHFEKAMDTTDGSYAAINQAFAAYLMEKYPEVKWLNREDDLGIEGLRNAKLSYKPDRLVEKYWARFWEDDDEDAD
jgi:DNA-binding transcriptional regulator YhcF (GntR family)